MTKLSLAHGCDRSGRSPEAAAGPTSGFRRAALPARGWTARPPAENLAKQQRQLDRFRHRYNYERPRDALDGDFPAERWQRSEKEYSGRLRKPEYPGHLEVRRVSASGTFRRLSGQYFLSNALKGEDVGLEEVDDGTWSIVYYNTILGRIDLQTGRITGNDKL